MDRIELAERRYQAIIPKPPADPWQLPHRELEVWLLNDVCPVVADYVNRPRFREQATWPLDRLRMGADSEERRVVDAFDRALVTCATTLAKLAGNAPVADALKELYPPRESVIRGEIEIAEDKSRRRNVEKGMLDTLAIEMSQIRGIAERFWIDLVCEEDYFEPRGGWMFKDSTGRLQPGEFIVSFNPDLLPIGDLISRTMLRRAELLVGEVKTFRGKCLRAVARAGRRYPAQVTAVEESWEQLEAKYQTLQAAIRAAPTAALRESCVILTQVYAAYQPSPDLHWLNLPDQLIRDATVGLRFRLTDRRGLEVAERVAAALGDLRSLYVGTRPEQAAIEEAIASRGLVLLREPREAYWASERVDVDWYRHDTSWQFLWALAQKAARSSPIGEADLFDDVVSRSAMSTAFGRLKKHLPADLWRHILPGATPRTYRMDLQDRRAYLF